MISRYSSDGQLATVPRLPAVLPAAVEAELSVAALLAGDATQIGHRPDGPGEAADD